MFGKNGEEATKKELQQMHFLKAFTLIDGSQLTEQEKSSTISSLMFLTEK